MLEAVEVTAGQTIAAIHAIKAALFDLQRDLGVSRVTATRYLDALAGGGFVRKHRIGRGNYYINLALNAVLQPQPAQVLPTPAAP